MEEELRKPRKVEAADERAQRLELEASRRAANARAEDDAVDAMVKRSIEQYGP